MLKKLILCSLIVTSSSTFSYGFDNDYSNYAYQQEMLAQQQEQTRIMQQQATNQFNAAQDERLYQDNMVRNQLYGNN